MSRFEIGKKVDLIATLITGIAAVLLSACDRGADDGSGLTSEDDKLSAHVELARVFVKQGDSSAEKPEYVYLGGGSEITGQRCSFLQVAKTDSATPWPPIQTVWGIYAPTKYTMLKEHYAGLGHLTANQLGGGTTGFRDLGYLEKKMVSVGNPQISNSGDTVSMTIELPASSVTMIDAQGNRTVLSDKSAYTVDLSAKLELKDTRCVATVAYCIVDEDCASKGKHRTLSSITVQRAKGFFGGAESVVIR